MVDWGSVGRTIFDKAAPELSRLYSAKQEGKLGEAVLAKAFPDMYALSKKYRSFRDQKKGTRDTSEISTGLNTLAQVTAQQTDAIGEASSLIAQQNQILGAILQQLKENGSNKGPGLSDLADLLDLKGKGKPKATEKPGKPKAKEGYRYDERTGRYHNEKTNRMVSQEEATGQPKAKPVEKVGGPQVGEGATPKTPSVKGGGIGGAVAKGLGPVAIAMAIYDAWKEIDALDINDPDFKKKVTKIISNAVAQFGLATVGAVMATMVGTAVFPGIGTLVGLVVGVAGGVAAQAVFGDSVESLVDYVVEKLYALKAPKAMTGAALVAPDGSAKPEDQTKSTEDGKLANEGGEYGTIEYEADNMSFDADEMEINAERIELEGVNELGSLVQEGTTQIGQAPSGTPGKEGGPGGGGKPPAESEVNKDLNLETITSKSGRSTKVAGAYKENFQGFIDELEGTGYVIKDLGGYAYRPNVNNPSVLSYHSFGAAIDINPIDNQNQSVRTDMPSETGGIASKFGLGWGINFRDPMHFSIASAEGGSVPLSRTGQKIESYGSGGKANKSGPAIVGDARGSKSNAEVVKSGGTTSVYKKPSLVSLAKGDQVYTMEQAKDVISSPQGIFNIATGLAGMIPGAQQVIAGVKTVGAVGTNLAQGNVKGALKQGLIEASGAIPDPTGLASSAIEYGLDQAMPDRPAPRQAPPQKAQKPKSTSNQKTRSSTELLAMSVSGT